MVLMDRRDFGMSVEWACYPIGARFARPLIRSGRDTNAYDSAPNLVGKP